MINFSNTLLKMKFTYYHEYNKSLDYLSKKMLYIAVIEGEMRSGKDLVNDRSFDKEI